MIYIINKLSVVRCKIVRRKEKANILIKQNLCFTSYKALLYVLQSNGFQIGMIQAKQIILEIQKDKFFFITLQAIGHFEPRCSQ